VPKVAVLLFLDQTSLAVGPHAEVKLDRFVYNPERGGNVVIQAGRGAFRFVTGTQYPASYTIKTPLATIGVRGTIFELTTKIERINNRDVTEEIIVLVQGEVVVRTRDGQSHELVKPGTAFALTDASGAIKLEGPITWDGTIYEVAGKISFLLYGANFWLDPQPTPAPDSRLDLNDQLDALILGAEPPPRVKCTPSPPCP
jgi:hypothetical protein